MSTKVSTFCEFLARWLEVSVHEVSEILVKGERVGEVLRGLYEYRKEVNSKFSLQYICQKAGVASKGHLADVMGFRRKLKLEYAKPISKVMGLDPRQTKIFVLLTKLEKSRDHLERKRLSDQISRARKILRSVEEEYVPLSGDPVDFSRVFCSLSLIEGPASPQRISELLQLSLEKTKAYLDQLVDRGFLQRQSSNYVLSQSEVRFSRGQYVEMLKAYIDHSHQKVDKWISSEDSFFESATISVSMKDYRQILSRLKEELLEQMSGLEAEKADALIHFNIQIYPDL